MAISLGFDSPSENPWNDSTVSACRLAVRIGDSALLEVGVVGTAPGYDLAVLRTLDAPPGLQPIAIGTSEDSRVGQIAFGLGSPFGLTRTLTKGIVSALD